MQQGGLLGVSPKSNTRSIGAGYVNVRLATRDQGYYPGFVNIHVCTCTVSIHVHVYVQSYMYMCV